MSAIGEFQGRAVVVSGGGGALGQAVVSRLLAAGANVHVPAHDESDTDALSRLESPQLHIAPSVDLSEEAHVTAFYEGVADLYASVHIAGGFVWGDLAEATVADFDRMVAMNLRTAWLCCRESARRMSGEGRIVNVSARPALVPSPQVVTYAATKAAVAALSQSLAEELAPRGIWVNAVVPSMIDTPANRSAMPDADFDAWATPDAIASTILFLASPQNAATRGALIPVYGKS